jgi:hypothetical protein
VGKCGQAVGGVEGKSVGLVPCPPWLVHTVLAGFSPRCPYGGVRQEGLQLKGLNAPRRGDMKGQGIYRLWDYLGKILRLTLRVTGT